MPFSLKDAILRQPPDVAGPGRARTVEEEDAIRAARTPAQRRLENAISLLFGAIGLPTSDSDERPNQWARAGEVLSAAAPFSGPLRAAKAAKTVTLEPQDFGDFMRGFAERIRPRLKSPYLKELSGVGDQLIGSTIPARLASGQHPRTGQMLNPSEGRALQQELYDLTQEALSEQGLDPSDELRLWRGGNYMENPYVLTPTSVNQQTAAMYSPRLHSRNPSGVVTVSAIGPREFAVRRDRIRLLPSLVSRRDRTTQQEVLVPTGFLTRSLVKEPSSLAGIVHESNNANWNTAGDDQLALAREAFSNQIRQELQRRR